MLHCSSTIKQVTAIISYDITYVWSYMKVFETVGIVSEGWLQMQDIGNSGHWNVGCKNDRPTGGEDARHENVTQICQKFSHCTLTVLSPYLGKVNNRRIALNLTNLTK